MLKKNEVTEIVRERKEILREYYITTAQKNLTVYGRVIKFTTEDHVVYGGSFSHFFLFTKDSPAYIGEDDNIIATDFDQADIQVQQYLEDFTDEFGTKKNKLFK